MDHDHPLHLEVLEEEGAVGVQVQVDFLQEVPQVEHVQHRDLEEQEGVEDEKKVSHCESVFLLLIMRNL
jgi:hypothetical protein